MFLKTLPNIETARLLLRGLQKGDEEFLVMLDTDPVVMRYNEGGPISHRQATHFARMQVEMADSIWKTTGKWLVELKGTPTRIGWVNVSGFDLEDLASLSVSYQFAPSFWGHGYAFEAIAAVVDDCFERLDEPHIVAQVRWDNERSVRVLRKLGFRPRGRRFLDGADHLCELYEITQNEWQESRVLGPDPIRNEDSTPYLTPEQYFELEHAAVIKSEQRKGLTRATTGETVDHSAIVVNIIGELRNRLRACRVFNRDLQVHVPATGFYTYPDVSVVCGDVKLLDDQKDVLLNPVLIVEVLSASTGNYDSGHKFGEYSKIPGLCDYLMVDETRPFIQHWAERDGRWVLTQYKDLTGTVELVSVPSTLQVAGIYDGIKF